MKALVFFLLFSFFGIVHAEIFDLGDSSALHNESSGNFYKTNSSGSVSAVKSGTSLNLTEKANIPSSKGFFSVDLHRTVPVDVNRIGKSVRTVAVASGPVGLTIQAVSLVCELTTICESAGQWLFGSPVTEVTSLTCATVGSGTVTYKSGGYYHKYKLIPKANCGGVTPSGWGIVASCSPSILGCAWGDDMIKETAGSPVTQAYTPAAPTTADWDAKEPLLNDQRFIDPLLQKGTPVPVGNPQIPTPQKITTGSETTTTKDGAGNTTGTQTKTDEIEISQPSATENPTNSPSAIKITENSTTNNYNTSNQLTSSVTTVTNNTATATTTTQQPIMITIDDVPDVPLQSVAVPGTFSFSTWGSGACPAPKTWVTMFGTHEFSYQLTCDFATTAKPIILLIAAIVSFMIVASIRTE